jgi:23S rRNA (cytosine1962-C5)-methyltransferase
MPDANLTTARLPGYELLDSGEGRKLERIAGHLVDRPCPPALWSRRLDAAAWAAADSICERTADGGGRWRHRRDEPAGLELVWDGPAGRLRFAVRFTPFGHCGVFFETEPVWRLLQEWLAARGPGGRCANLFGYTGCASLAMAASGAEVFHVDSARGVVEWGRGNAASSGLPADRIHWICDDVRSFLRLGRKRGFRYDLILADPPSWGHGTEKGHWDFERDLMTLVADCASLLAEGGALLLSCHTQGMQREGLRNCLAAAGRRGIVVGELGVGHAGDDRVLPAGIYAMG